MNIFSSYCYQYCKNIKYNLSGINTLTHGFAWAMNRKIYDKIVGLYDINI